MTYKAGQKLGNYQLERFLGHGGFAEVYLGKHIYLNTYAAIKVLHRQMNDEALASFLQEARIIASLQHPHIVRVLDFGIEEQHPFLVMAYAPQGTLRRRYRKGQILSPTLVAPYIRQIADALYYAHTRRIIHRDVKPENMLIDHDNGVLLSDFGLAVKEQSTYRSVHSADSAGTTIYMAPEQLQGKPVAASDQYALGVVMYEWLCGCLPFDGPDISVVVQHLHELPTPLRKHVSTIPKEIEGIVLKALEKDPKQRFANVQELASVFEEACKNLPIPATATEIPSSTLFEHGGLAPGELQQASLWGESEELWTGFTQDKVQPGRNEALPELSQPSEPAFLQTPSLPASWNMSILTQDTAVGATVSTASSQRKASISRRAVLAGIAGMGLLLGGVGIWHFSASETKTLPLRVQDGHTSSGAVASAPTATKQASTTRKDKSTGVRSTPEGLPVNNVAGKQGTAHPTPSSSNPLSSGKPTATSTPAGNNNGGGSSGVTPTATSPAATPQAGLTVQINNPPSSVQDRTTTYISITTSMGNISFQFSATYYGLKNQSPPPDVKTGTTDGSGTGGVNWTPSLPPGQVVTGTYADISVSVTDQNGKQVSSQTFQVQITRGQSDN